MQFNKMYAITKIRQSPLKMLKRQSFFDTKIVVKDKFSCLTKVTTQLLLVASIFCQTSIKLNFLFILQRE